LVERIPQPRRDFRKITAAIPMPIFSVSFITLFLINLLRYTTKIPLYALSTKAINSWKMVQDPRKYRDPPEKLIDLTPAHAKRHFILKSSAQFVYNF